MGPIVTAGDVEVNIEVGDVASDNSSIVPGVVGPGPGLEAGLTLGSGSSQTGSASTAVGKQSCFFSIPMPYG